MNVITAIATQRCRFDFNRLDVIQTEKVLIADNSVTLEIPVKGDLNSNFARIYDDNVTDVFSEYTCTLNEDKVTVLFDPADNLNGKYCVLTYVGYSVPVWTNTIINNNALSFEDNSFGVPVVDDMGVNVDEKVGNINLSVSLASIRFGNILPEGIPSDVTFGNAYKPSDDIALISLAVSLESASYSNVVITDADLVTEDVTLAVSLVSVEYTDVTIIG